MKLNELLKHVKPLDILGDTEVEITGVNIDSRRIEKGHLFVAMKGTQVDGHQFISKAIEQGAVAVLCEDMPNRWPQGLLLCRWNPQKMQQVKSLRSFMEIRLAN